METGVVLAVLVGAMLHASWNALVKSSGDKQLDIALVHFLGALVSLPLLILTLGLFYFILNAILLWVASTIIPGYTIAGFVPALIGSLVLMVVNWAIGALVKK